jgi:hypothetical protein
MQPKLEVDIELAMARTTISSGAASSSTSFPSGHLMY